MTTVQADAGRTTVQADANQNAQGDKPKRIVKRYSNRKLYDTRESRYVTLLQIAEMVRTGEEVQIIDNATKEDLTEVTLAQIIYEEQKHHSRSVPLATLRDLIHQRGERLMTQLRDTPLGRLLPEDKVDGTTPAVAAPVVVDEASTYGGAPAKDGDKRTILDQSREAFETFQKGMDERIKSVLASFSPFQQLQAEVVRLTSRIDELEAKLKAQESSKAGTSK
ncbi:MAG: polyhydroxyalkanoate synthesis regulator DNA-binding domain-containing protein, partial [Polyangiales bacterium]